MVNIFIVHSGKDYDYVKETVEPSLLGIDEDLDENSVMIGNANILTMKSGTNYNWKKEARKVLKIAQVVLVVVGEDSCDPSKKKTMGWEILRANKYHKQIMILNPKNLKLPDFLYTTDHFTGQRRLVADQMTLEQIKERIDNYANGYYDIFSKKYSRMDDEEKGAHKNEILDQYKMFQKSSEDLVARRQSVNSFYISVNSALVALVGVVMGVVEMPAKLYVIAFMCITGIILDISWVNILDSYGTLNAAKMKVIRLLEEQLPIELYDAEWRIMSDKLNNKKYVSFTNSEKRIPRIFSIVYIVIIIAIIIFLLLNYVFK